MALDKHVQGDAKPDSTPHNPPVDLESDIAELAALLTHCRDDPPEDGDDSQVAELLKRLTAADGVAKGVEERLDGLIENLDMLLTALEKDPVNERPPEAATEDKTDNSLKQSGG